jgi:RNA polymerase sigma factor (sigma-70 family)
VEVSALKYSGGIGLHARSPLLRLQSDERLVALIRRGNTTAFEVLVSRYSSRLLAFCRHLLGSREDAEDVLQEIFAASFNAILVDERPINVRPWLYRIARNRCLNHLRRIQAIGVESMDVHLSDHGASTADKVHEREEFRLLVGDIHELPETQRTALVLREMDALPYEQIAEAMETTVPSVKSLLVRARVSLAEAAEARLLTCDEVRIELGEVAEGLRRRPSPLVRRHLRACKRCSVFREQLKETNKALAALLPIGPLALFKQFVLGHVTTHSAGAGSTAAGSGAGAGAAGAGAGAGAAGSGVFAGSTASGFVSAGVGALATKAAAGLAVATLVTAGAVEVTHTSHPHHTALAWQHATTAPATVAGTPQPASHQLSTNVNPSHPSNKPAVGKTPAKSASKTVASHPKTPPKPPAKPTTTTTTTTPTTTTTSTSTPEPGRTQTQTDPTVLSPPGTPSSTTPTSTGGGDAGTTPVPVTTVGSTPTTDSSCPSASTGPSDQSSAVDDPTTSGGSSCSTTTTTTTTTSTTSSSSDSSTTGDTSSSGGDPGTPGQ